MVRWPAGSHTRQCSSFSLCNLAPPGERAPEAKRKSANALEDTCIWVWRLCVSCVASYMPRRKAMDSLRQLTMKFLEKDELAGYNFQALVLCLQSGLQVCRVHDRMAHMECNVFWCWLPHVCSNVLCRYAQHLFMQLHVDTTFIVIFWAPRWNLRDCLTDWSSRGGCASLAWHILLALFFCRLSSWSPSNASWWNA